MGKSEPINQRADNVVVKGICDERQTMADKTLHRQLGLNNLNAT